MIKSLKLFSVVSIALALAACNGGIKPENKAEILSSPALNSEQLRTALSGNTFAANVLSGNSGRYTFKFGTDGTLYINKSGYNGTQQWSVEDDKLCVKTCHEYYQDAATGILYGTTDGKISAILTPK